MVAIIDSQRDLASSDDGEVGEDEDDEETDQGKLSEDDETCWVMGTISKSGQQSMGRLRQKQMNIDELAQPGWLDAADYFHQRDKKYGTSESTVPAVVKPQMDDDAAAPATITFGEVLESLDIVPGISQKPQVTSRPGSSHGRSGSA